MYNISYNYNTTTDAFVFFVEAKVTGWVVFGFASLAPNMNIISDIAVGGVFSNGTGYLQVGHVYRLPASCVVSNRVVLFLQYIDAESRVVFNCESNVIRLICFSFAFNCTL